MVTSAGEAPAVIRLPLRLARWLKILAQATATAGTLSSHGDPRLRKAMTELVAAGVPVIVARGPRSDGGAGQCATYRLAGTIEVVPFVPEEPEDCRNE